MLVMLGWSAVNGHCYACLRDSQSHIGDPKQAATIILIIGIPPKITRNFWKLGNTQILGVKQPLHSCLAQGLLRLEPLMQLGPGGSKTKRARSCTFHVYLRATPFESRSIRATRTNTNPPVITTQSLQNPANLKSSFHFIFRYPSEPPI